MLKCFKVEILPGPDIWNSISKKEEKLINSLINEIKLLILDTQDPKLITVPWRISIFYHTG